jgi:hypothetical protein
MEISPESFFVFKEGEEVKINVCLVMELLFHEILGHGMHEIFSREMPLSMQDNSINVSVPSSHVHFEGVSQLAEKEAIDFMRLYKKKYNVEEDYIDQRIFNGASTKSGSFQTFYQFLGLKKIEDDSFDQDGEFRKITKNNGLTVLYSSSNVNPLSCIHGAAYPVGLEYLSSFLEELKEEMGEESFMKNKSIITKATTHGVFNFRVLPKFVRYYLKESKVV